MASIRGVLLFVVYLYSVLISRVNGNVLSIVAPSVVPGNETLPAATDSTDSSFDEDVEAVSILPGEEEDPWDKLSQDVVLYEGGNASGSRETISIVSGQCNPLSLMWILGHPVGAIKYNSECIRLWETTQCKGHTRCYCELDILSLDQLPMSETTFWHGHVHALSMCYLENDTFSRALLFSGSNYEGNHTSIILETGECVTFYEGDPWRNSIQSVVVTDGCVEYFTEDMCRGISTMEIGNGEEPNTPWSGRIKSIKNCASLNTTSDS